jgi:UDPglucose--hexose-1-phosphate uridylyltransferase
VAFHSSRWEERWHPLREEWVILAAHRQDRPWQGERVATTVPALPPYVSDCYFCPANPRISGARNPAYRDVFVFDNDHPCVGPDAPRDLETPPAPYRNRPATGLARVVCYSPLHNVTLAELDVPAIDRVLETISEQYRELGTRPEAAHVLVFENKGDVVGVSNPHPHCQIYATNFVFKTIETEAAVTRRYFAEQRRPLFGDIIQAERADGRRVIFENDTAIAFLPYFARYAYECFVAPKGTHAGLASLNAAERRDLAEALKALLVRYDNLWRMPFPYVLTFHHAPTDGADHSGFHFHLECHPPLRKPGLLKYLAGPEVGGGSFLSDTLPEEKAAELLAVSNVHYKVADGQTA